MNNKFFNFMFYYITHLGGLVFLSLLTLSLLFIKGQPRKLGLEILLGQVLTSAIVQILKRIFLRNRPYWILDNLNTYGIDLSDYSFPSGHSAASFSVATIVACNYSNLALIVFILAGLVAISRIYLAVHYPTDVLAGIIIGVASSLAVHYFIFSALYVYLENKFTWEGNYTC